MLLAGLVQPADAKVRLAPGFSSGMVLQRDMPSKVSGWADEGEIIKVQLGNEVVAETVGRGDAAMWSVDLPPMKAGPIPDLVVSGSNTVTLSNLLAGDVWVCSGQSNMEMTPYAHGGIENAANQVANAKNPFLRFYISTNRSAPWTDCTPESTAKFSAAGYFFGSHLQKELKVPIGLILAATGGTRAESWAPPAVADSVPAQVREEARKTIQELLPQWTIENDAMTKWKEESKKAKEAGLPPPPKPEQLLSSKQKQDLMDARALESMGNLYTPKIQPVTAQSIKGVIWYQGESNAAAAGDYVWLMTQLISGWRSAWQQRDLPFLIMQLVNFQTPSSTNWVKLRADQQRIAETVPDCHIAIGLDLGDPKNIHPPNKKGVGTRLALIALKEVYGHNITAHGPRVQEISSEGGVVKVRLDAGGDGEELSIKAPAQSGLELAGNDKKYIPAIMRFEGKNLLLEAPTVSDPRWVRYAQSDNPLLTLFNSSGLPAAPFELPVPFSKKSK
jgi:sialate O-acetylesterase